MGSDPDCDFLPDPWGGEPPKLLLNCQSDAIWFFHSCYNAQTLEAFSKRFRTTVWFALPCKKWSCRICANKKIKTLAAKTRDAKPNRLLTLTVDPEQWDNPRHAFDGTRRKLPELVKKLRTKVGQFEYLRVTELTKRGWPHYHMLVRSPFIPHAVAKQVWKDLTGAIIVDLRQVHDTFQSYHYLVKYLAKLHQIGWTERHVSYSRGFFPPRPKPPGNELELEDHTIIECHPGKLLYNQYRHAELVEIAYGVFTINPAKDLVEEQTGDPFYPPDPPEPNPCSPEKNSTTSKSSSSTQKSFLDEKPTNFYPY